MEIFKTGDVVRYLGHEAVVMHGNENSEWIPEGSQMVNIKLTSPPRGWSRQIDAYARTLTR